MNVTCTAFRKAIYSALLLSVLGMVLVCTLIAGPQHTAKWAAWWSPQIATGYAVMIIAIETVGMPLRTHLAQYWVGALFGLAVFIAGVIAGSATSMPIYRDFDPFAYIIKPLFWMGIYGFIPALILGCISTAILRRISYPTE